MRPPGRASGGPTQFPLLHGTRSLAPISHIPVAHPGTYSSERSRPGVRRVRVFRRDVQTTAPCEGRKQRCALPSRTPCGPPHPGLEPLGLLQWSGTHCNISPRLAPVAPPYKWLSCPATPTDKSACACGAASAAPARARALAVRPSRRARPGALRRRPPRPPVAPAPVRSKLARGVSGKVPSVLVFVRSEQQYEWEYARHVSVGVAKGVGRSGWVRVWVRSRAREAFSL